MLHMKLVNIHPVLERRKHSVQTVEAIQDNSVFLRFVDWIESNPDRLIDFNLIMLATLAFGVGAVIGSLTIMWWGFYV